MAVGTRDEGAGSIDIFVGPVREDVSGRRHRLRVFSFLLLTLVVVAAGHSVARAGLALLLEPAPGARSPAATSWYVALV